MWSETDEGRSKTKAAPCQIGLGRNLVKIALMWGINLDIKEIMYTTSKFKKTRCVLRCAAGITNKCSKHAPEISLRRMGCEKPAENMLKASSRLGPVLTYCSPPKVLFENVFQLLPAPHPAGNDLAWRKSIF